MNKSNKLLSEIVAYRTYAKHINALNRRESLEETINRNMVMFLDKYPKLSSDIVKAFKQVHDLKVMPSMRSLQFGGEAIHKNNVRLFNCSFANVTYTRVFAESLYLLLSGTGFGYSVQRRHISQLPTIRMPKEENVFIVHDSIEGWADSLDALMNAYFYGAVRPLFDLSRIRSKGSYLVTTGAKAPGPEPLKQMLAKVESMIKSAIGRKLTSIEVHDIVCVISDCVLAGGIRRAALISLFDKNDDLMLKCKHGNWWEKHPYRARANNSAVLHRDETTYEEFKHVFDMCIASNAGEPGFFWTNDYDVSTNPCCFVGSTLIKTDKGYERLDTLAGREVNLVNKDNKIAKGKVWSSGVKSTLVIKNTNGEMFQCTTDHRFLLNDGTECVAEDLHGKRIMPNVNLNNTNDEFTKLGFIQGDGSLTRLNSSAHKGLEVHIGRNDKDIASLFNIEYDEDIRSYYINGYNDILRDLQFDASTLVTREFPKTFDNWSDSQKLSFVRGMYSANGSIIKHNRIAYKSVSKNLINKLSSYLKSIGITNYITTNKPKDVNFSNGIYECKESYDLNISSFRSCVKFAELIGFVHNYKSESLLNLINEKSPVINSITLSGYETVYDFNLDDETHWGVISSDGVVGYVAHNCEISLRSNQFCNLSTINLTGIKSDKDLNNRVYAAALLGTLQAGFTDFPYLSEKWRAVTEEEALIGVSFTGIADSANLSGEELQKAAKLVLEVNEKYARKIGTNLSARTTAIKPEGTASCVLGSSSGIHARHSDYYLRRVRMNKDDELAMYLSRVIPDLVEADLFSSSGVVVTIPQESPKHAITRHSESAMDLFNRVKHYYANWILPGHRSGPNTHNVSCTINYKPEEVPELLNALWNDRNSYAGISLLPFSDAVYQQAPFEDCNKETFDKYEKLVKEIDLTKVMELEDKTNRGEQLACAGGVCELNL